MAGCAVRPRRPGQAERIAGPHRAPEGASRGRCRVNPGTSSVTHEASA